MRILMKCLVATAVSLIPVTALAQASLTGTVRDGSGAVLPGVTVEASSEALIEKTRSAVTDGSGQYRIVDLRAGTYTLTFALTGFSTVKRGDIDVAGTQTVTISVDMRIGGVAETITVVGETPVVDTQSVKRELVLNADVIQGIPATRAVGSLLNVTPGLTVDTNGLQASPTMTFFSARGGPVGEGRMAVNGMVVAAANGGGGVSTYVYDSPNAEEVTVNISGGLGESDIGGPVMNLVPRSGGNTFKGSAFVNEAGDWSRGDNLDDRLRSIGITQPPGTIKAYDASISYGGPIKRDRFWFFGGVRQLDSQTAVEGITANANAYDATRWDWVGSPITARLVKARRMFIGRGTVQVGKNRFSLNSEYQLRCEGTPLKVETNTACRTRGSDWIGLGTTTQSPEATSTASSGYFDWPYYVNQGFWTAPLTSRLLLEAGFSLFRYYPTFGYPPPDGITNLIGVTEQSNTINPATGLRFAPNSNYAYRGIDQWGGAHGSPNSWRASASYVTGAHSLKIGYQGGDFTQYNITYTADSQLAYRFSQGVPNAVTYRLPDWAVTNTTRTESLFVQDAWTRGRLTVQGAVRYDHVSSFSPAEGNGTARASWTNPAAIQFGTVPGVDAYNDVTPRLGVAYDVFGNGKTAVKFNWGHYLGAATNDSPYNANNPASTTKIVTLITNRQWSDTNTNKVVDCDLGNPARQTAVDTCAELTGNQLNFGKTGNNVTQIDPRVLSGWGARNNDYQWGVNVQQEIIPRVSVEVGYNRRWFHGRTVTDNLARVPSDYESYTLTAPIDARLPNGGGYPITIYTPTAAAAAIPAQNILIFEKDAAGGGSERDDYWHGVDVALNARLRGGLQMQVGTTTGRGVVDTCRVVKFDSPDLRGCHNADPVQTTLRGQASYTIPRLDVLVAATLRSQPGAQLSATWNVPNTVIQGALGHLPAGSLATGNTTVQLVRTTIVNADEVLYSDQRRTQVDMRFAKILRFGRTRNDIGIDLGNLLNTNYATTYENTYQYSPGNTLLGGTWNNPTAIYTPRFVRINYTLNF